MNRRNDRFLFIAIMAIATIFLAGCPNNLVDKINEEVKVVVTPPSVVSIYPETNAVNIPVGMDNVLITFTKGIDSSSVNNSTFITKDSDNNTVSGTYSVSNDTIAFNPSSSLHYSTVYTITAKSAILDIDGNPMSDEFSWTFTTEEAPVGIQPVIQVFEIDNGKSATNSENVELGIYATDHSGGTSGLKFHYRPSGDTNWSEWLDLTDGSGTVSKTLSIVSGVTETFTFEAEAKDLQGILSSITSTQIIYEVTAPSIVDVNWDDELFFPYNGSSIRITFDEEMSPSSFTNSDLTLEKTSGGGSLEGQISVNSSDTTTNSIVELWGLKLDPNTEYKVILQPGVTDIAGNPLGGDAQTWIFSTGDSTDTTPPSGDVLLVDGVFGKVVTLLTGSIAKGTDNKLRIDLSNISDDYNTVWGMKFWGDNDGSAGEESFEQNAVWKSFATTNDWNVSTGDGIKFVLYKFVDSAGNESPTPGQLKIILDNSPPSTPVITINNGDAYTNSSDRTVNLSFSSTDASSGVKEMMISNADTFNDASWETWSPTVNGWELTAADGPKTVYVKTRDYLDQPSLPGDRPIILDRIDPIISFNTDNILVHSEVQLVRDITPSGDDIYQIVEDNFTNSIYSWEQISGPENGNVYFNDSTGTGTGNTGIDISDPFVWADTDGSYFIQLTFTDSAGNSSSNVALFTWDSTAPGVITGLTVPAYNSTGQPVWAWDSVSDADYYEVSFASDFSGSFTTNTNSFSPNSVLTPDGVKTLYVRSMDDAGNSSVSSFASVHVDITNPTITVINNSYIANKDFSEISIDFSGDNGTVSDSATGSSGLDSGSYFWSKTSGSGTVNFGSPNALVTTVSATANDSYQIRLTVTDIAGNSTYADLSFLRDINEPGTPIVSGPALTPSVRPTWFWTSGGEGSGIYQWNLDTDTDPNWSAETSLTSFMPSLDLDDTSPGVIHTLSVREKDAAGNWSSPGSWAIEIDEDAKTPPSISINDGIPALRNVPYITWNAVSGLGGAGTQYQYRIDGLSWTVKSGSLSIDPTSPTVISQFTALAHGTHTLEIQEYLTDGSAWQTEKTGSHTITVDLVPPSIPSLSSQGLDTGDNDRKATNDTTPQWTWSSSGGGNGKFKYQLTRINAANGTSDSTSIVSLTSETTVTSYTSGVLSEGTYEFKVQERDDAGNWSSFATIKTTIDTTFPGLTSVAIEGTTRSDDTDNTYTRSANVAVHIVGDISTEDNSSYSRPVAINVYDYNPSAWVDYATPWSTSNPAEETISLTLPVIQGTRYVYIRLRDEAGNTTSYIYDTVVLDTIAPSGTFTINNGSSYTPSLSFKMNFNITDNISQVTDLLVNSYDYYGTDGDGTGWEGNRAYSSLMSSDLQFSIIPGTKTVPIQVSDAAGNILNISDTITLELPVPTYAWKGYYGTGATRVYYDPVTEDPGSATTYYYTYSSTNPLINPNSDASGLTNHGGTTSTAYRYLSGLNTEEFRYYWIRAYNGDTGGWGPFSATNVMGYSANITIIYDDDDSVDTTLAQTMKSVLKSNYPSSSPTYITGTMPSWTVMLLPEDMVSTVYGTGNIIYGDPVIITPSATAMYSTSDRVRNVVAGGHGIVAMSLGGLYFIDRASDNWTAWGYPATTTTVSLQQPNEIGYGNAYTITADKYYMYTWRYGNSVWTSPLSSTSIPVSTSEDQVQVGYTSGLLTERALTRTGKNNPVNGYIYGRSQDYSDKFPVVRQGRFLYYGYDGLWTRTYTGRVYFINLISRMAGY